MNLPARLRWLWLTLAVVLLDRATKAWFETHTVEGWRHELIHNFVYFVHSRNPGLAFGILSDSASMGTRILRSVVWHLPLPCLQRCRFGNRHRRRPHPS